MKVLKNYERFQTRKEAYLAISDAHFNFKRTDYAASFRKRDRMISSLKRSFTSCQLFDASTLVYIFFPDYDTYELTVKLKALCRVFEFSNDQIIYRHGLFAINMLLKSDKEELFSVVPNTNLIEKLIDLLEPTRSDEVTEKTINVLSKLAYSPLCAKALMGNDILARLINILKIEKKQITKYCLQCIGNLTADANKYSKALLNHQLSWFFLNFVSSAPVKDTGTLRSISWITANLSKLQKTLTLEEGKNILALSEILLQQQDETILTDTFHTIKNFSSGNKGILKELSNSILPEKVIEHFHSGTQQITHSAVLTISTILSRKNHFSPELTIFDHLIPILTHEAPEIRQEGLFIVGTLITRSPEYAETLISHQALSHCAHSLQDPSASCKLESSHVFSNISRFTSLTETTLLSNHSLSQLILSSLISDDARYLLNLLDFLKQASSLIPSPELHHLLSHGNPTVAKYAKLLLNNV